MYYIARHKTIDKSGTKRYHELSNILDNPTLLRKVSGDNYSIFRETSTGDYMVIPVDEILITLETVCEQLGVEYK